MNPPPPSGGGRRVGYPGARGGRHGARPPHRAEVTGSELSGRAPVHRTSSAPRSPSVGRPRRPTPPLRSGAKRGWPRVAPPSRGGKREPRPVGTRSRLRGVCVVAAPRPLERGERGTARLGGDDPNPTPGGEGKGKRPPRHTEAVCVSRAPADRCVRTGNDPSAGSPTETLLRLLLPLNATVWSSSRQPGRVIRQANSPRTSLKRSIGSSDGRCVQRAGT